MKVVPEQLNQQAVEWINLTWTIVWQSTLVVLIIAVLIKLLLRHSPEWRYWIWQIVAVKLLLMPFWTFAITIPGWGDTTDATDPTPLVTVHDERIPESISESTLGSSTPQISEPVAPNTVSERLSSSTLNWQAWLVLAWLGILGLQIFRLAYQRHSLTQLLAKASPCSLAIQKQIENLSESLQLRRIPKAVVVDQNCSPFVCGVRRPTIVLPRDVLHKLNETQLAQILLHELSHVKRHDLLWGWIPEIARIIYWFHPAVMWVNYRIRFERELACDRVAMLQSGHPPAEYAKTLIDVILRNAKPALLATLPPQITAQEPLP